MSPPKPRQPEVVVDVYGLLKVEDEVEWSHPLQVGDVVIRPHWGDDDITRYQVREIGCRHVPGHPGVVLCLREIGTNGMDHMQPGQVYKDPFRIQEIPIP